MTFQYPSPGVGDVASYMTAGLPWVSSSAIPSGSTWTINFPYVTSELLVENAGLAASSLGLGFTLSGSQGTGPSGSTCNFRLNSSTTTNGTFFAHVRCKSLFVTALTNNVTASVFAGLTVIKTNQFPTLTGSTNPYLSASIPDPVFGYTGLG